MDERDPQKYHNQTSLHLGESQNLIKRCCSWHILQEPVVNNSSTAGKVWLSLLVAQLLAAEHYIRTYAGSWREEFSDYFSFWGHYVCLLFVIPSILCPQAVAKVPVLRQFDFVKLNIIHLANTTVLWQTPRLERYINPEYRTWDFLMNSLIHGGNLICLIAYSSVTQRRFQKFNLRKALTVPTLYSLYIIARVLAGRSRMKHYVNERLGSWWLTPVVTGLIFLTLQIFTELYIFPRLLLLPGAVASGWGRFESSILQLGKSWRQHMPEWTMIAPAALSLVWLTSTVI